MLVKGCFKSDHYGLWLPLWYLQTLLITNRIGAVIVGVPVSSVIDRGLYIRSSQTKGYKIGICCYQ
jgi:hypothetical protein